MTFVIWVFLICALSGALNIYTILNFSSNSANHTGNVSRLSIEIANNAIDSRILVMIGLFFIGSLIAGILFHERSFSHQKRYGFIFIFGGLILIFNYFIKSGLNIYFIPALLGLQNGMFLTYNGAMCRFTHITGYLTDAAYEIGRVCRGKEDAQYWKIFFYLGSIISFMAGGIFVAEINHNEMLTILILSLGYVLNGIYFFIAREAKKESI